MRLYALLAAIVFVAACSKDSGTTTLPTTPTTNTFTLVLDAGMVDSQKVAIGTVIPVRVKLTSNSQPAAGIKVNWKVGSGHGAVSADTTITASNGVASVNWTIGDSAGTNTLTATTGTVSVTLTATGLAGAASQLIKISADSSVIVSGATLPLTARVTDRAGNGVPNAIVTWTTTGGSLSTATTASGSSGNVTSNFTAPAAGAYTVTATLPNKASVIFRVYAF